MALDPSPCMHRAANLLSARTPGQLAAGRGARQRKAPTGGAAKGMAL